MSRACRSIIPVLICAAIMLNYDVITIICAEMDRADVLSLGLASKKFLEPALDEMWRKLSSIEPLLSVLPETTLVNGQKVRIDRPSY